MIIETPLIVAEGHDVCAYRSVGEAEAHLEAIDVDAAIYRAWDATGRVLTLVAEGPRGAPTSRKVNIQFAQPVRDGSAELVRLLADVLVDQGRESPSPPEPLAVLLRKFVTLRGYV